MLEVVYGVFSVITVLIGFVSAVITIVVFVQSHLRARKRSTSKEGMGDREGAPTPSSVATESLYPRYPLLTFGTLVVMSLELAAVVGFAPFVGIFMQDVVRPPVLFGPEGSYIVFGAILLTGFFYFWVWLIALANAWALRRRVWVTAMLIGGALAAITSALMLSDPSLRSYPHGLTSVSLVVAALGQYVWYFTVLIFSIFGPTRSRIDLLSKS